MSYIEVVLRLLLAVVIGGIVGYEREYKNRPAGFRTHILVCVGAAVVSLISLFSLQDTIKLISEHPELANSIKIDVGRYGAQVISGIGFLGAGTIIHLKGSVRGLTTAASLWTVACIGLAVGLGYYPLSIIATLIVFIVLVTLKRFESRFLDKNKYAKLEIVYDNKLEFIKTSEDYFDSIGLRVKDIEFNVEDIETSDSKYNSAFYTIYVPNYVRKTEIIQGLVKLEHVIKVTLI
ncbi:MAG: MgtC/SapB family protein [Clostridiaceae bacterium]